MAWFYNIRSESLDNFFRTITWLGSLWILLPLFIFFLFWKKPKHNTQKILWASSIFFFSFTTARIMKYLISRERPDFFKGAVPLPHDPSFPSAHTTQAFSFILTLWLILYITGRPMKTSLFLLLILLATLVMISRVYLQVHFPSDTAAGLLIALFWTSVILYLFSKGDIP